MSRRSRRGCALGYTRFSEERIQQVTFGGSEVRTGVDVRWVFPNRARSEEVVLAPSFVVYETSNYDVFETFVERISAVIRVVADATKIDFVEQVGLRYVDLIRPAGERTASDFLRPHVRGLSSADLGARVTGHQFMTQAQSDSGDLYVRSFEKSGTGFLPPDLVSTHLQFKPDQEELAEETYRVLDIDHIAKREVEFTAAPIAQLLWELHSTSSKAFLAAVTDDAVTFWKKEV